ncbi:hypothetical protein [Streptomyces sp. AGS-58]
MPSAPDSPRARVADGDTGTGALRLHAAGLTGTSVDVTEPGQRLLPPHPA